MTNVLRTAAVTASIFAACAVPLAASAATITNAAPLHYQLQSRFFDRYGAGEYQGLLSLTIYPSGIVQGLYRPSDGGFRTVTGGIDGKNIWLDIGMTRPLHLTGTFSGGTLDTTAAIPSSDTYSFQAVQIPNN
jgi:hypothetical protein